MKWVVTGLTVWNATGFLVSAWLLFRGLVLQQDLWPETQLAWALGKIWFYWIFTAPLTIGAALLMNRWAKAERVSPASWLLLLLWLATFVVSMLATTAPR